MKHLSKLSESQQIRILQLFAGDTSTEEIASRFGISAQSIRRLAARLNIRKGQTLQPTVGEEWSDAGSSATKHVELRKQQRRGFWIPSELEQTYCNLLVKGMTRRQAGEALGLVESSADGQEDVL